MDGADVFFIIRKGTSGGTADDLDGEPTVRVVPEFSQIRFVVADGVTTIWQLNYGTDADDPANGIKRPRDFNALTNAKVWKKVSAASTGGGSFLSSSVARVDSSGNNGTGVVGDLTKPFLTIQGAINAIQAGNFTNPIVDIGQTSTTEDVTTSLGSIGFNVTVREDASAIKSITFTDLAPTGYFKNIIMQGAEIAINGASNLTLYFMGACEIGGNIQATGGITIYGNSECLISGTITSTGNSPIQIRNCSNNDHAGSLAIDSGTSNVSVWNTPIWFVSSANNLHLWNSVVYSTNNATTTFIDGPKWVELLQDLVWIGSAGVPTTNGTKYAGKGSLCSDYTNGNLYINTGSKATPDWKLVTRAA